jgi:hypothetical protein
MCSPDIPDPPPNYLPIESPKTKVAKVKGRKKKYGDFSGAMRNALAQLVIPLSQPSGVVPSGANSPNRSGLNI